MPRWIAATSLGVLAYALLFNSAPYESTKAWAKRNASLRVIAYNTQHLPLEFLNLRRDSEYRAKRQAELLADYDIVGLCEVFKNNRRAEFTRTLKRLWGDDFQVVMSPASDRSLLGLDSGLLFFTRHPVTQSHSLMFGNDSKVRERGFVADGYARKGVLHVRVQIDARTASPRQLDCFLTHLESQDSARRDEQISMLAEFIALRADPSNPILLLGDLNIRGAPADLANPVSQYFRLRQALAQVRPSWSDLGELSEPDRWNTSDSANPHRGDRIDYLFLANSPHRPPLVPLRAAVNPFPDTRVGYLSDHSAIEAEFRMERSADEQNSPLDPIASP